MELSMRLRPIWVRNRGCHLLNLRSHRLVSEISTCGLTQIGLLVTEVSTLKEVVRQYCIRKLHVVCFDAVILQVKLHNIIMDAHIVGATIAGEVIICSERTLIFILQIQFVHVTISVIPLSDFILSRVTPARTASRAFPVSVRNNAPPWRFSSRSVKSDHIFNSFFHSAYGRSSRMAGGWR